MERSDAREHIILLGSVHSNVELPGEDLIEFVVIKWFQDRFGQKSADSDGRSILTVFFVC
jgi:hypothetical protein